MYKRLVLLLVLIGVGFGISQLSSKPVENSVDRGFYLGVNDRATAYALQQEDSPDRLAAFEARLATYAQVDEIPIDLFEEFADLDTMAILHSLDQRPLCHQNAHNFGKLIYQDAIGVIDAITTCADTCTLGCIHGVLEEYLIDTGIQLDDPEYPDELVVAKIQDEVDAMCSHPDFVGAAQYQSECYHGIGHGFALLTDFNIDRSISLCKSLLPNSPFVGSCASGVYMERDSNLGQIDSQISDLYPCSESSELHQSCYQYKVRRTFDLRHNPQDLDLQNQALVACQNVREEDHRQACFYGLGSALIALAQVDFERMVEICSQGSPSEALVCIDPPTIFLASERLMDKVQCNVVQAQPLRERCVQNVQQFVGAYDITHEISQ